VPTVETRARQSLSHSRQSKYLTRIMARDFTLSGSPASGAQLSDPPSFARTALRGMSEQRMIASRRQPTQCKEAAVTRASGTALLAIAASSVACSQSPSPDASSLNSVEVNDVLVELPRTTRVTCDTVATDEFRFSWTGSNILVPRPLDGETRSSYVTLYFVADPPIAKAARIKLSFRGDVCSCSGPTSTAPIASPRTCTLPVRTPTSSPEA
jgi:hypothetical protein